MWAQELRDKLTQTWPGAALHLADGEYHPPTREELKDFLGRSFLERYRWRAEVFDCDDFALILHAFARQEAYRLGWPRPWALGEAWGWWPGWGHHARNLAVLAGGEVVLIEPQTDDLVLAGHAGGGMEWVRV